MCINSLSLLEFLKQMNSYQASPVGHVAKWTASVEQFISSTNCFLLLCVYVCANCPNAHQSELIIYANYQNRSASHRTWGSLPSYCSPHHGNAKSQQISTNMIQVIRYGKDLVPFDPLKLRLRPVLVESLRLGPRSVSTWPVCTTRSTGCYPVAQTFQTSESAAP